MRAFFCLPVDSEVRAVVGAAAERIRRETRMAASWVDPANYHVTLRFLGDIDPALTVELRTLAERAVAACPPFALTIRAIGAFPSLERARVLWAGGEAPDGFRLLVKSLERALCDLGFPSEASPTVAHVTIARVKSAPDRRLPEIAKGLGSLRLPDCMPRSVILMQSELASGGARYTPLFDVPITDS